MLSTSSHLADSSNVLLVGVLLNEIAQLWQKRPLDILKDALIEANAKTLVLLLVQLDEKLGGVERALVTVPLEEVLEGLLVLEDCAQARQSKTLKSVVASLDQIE